MEVHLIIGEKWLKKGFWSKAEIEDVMSSAVERFEYAGNISVSAEILGFGNNDFTVEVDGVDAVKDLKNFLFDDAIRQAIHRAPFFNSEYKPPFIVHVKRLS